MAMIKHNYPRSQHQGPVPIGSSFSDDFKGGLRPVNQSNNQQMLANVLKRQPSPQMSLTEEEKMIIMQIMQQQNLSEEQAIQQYMRMKSVG